MFLTLSKIWVCFVYLQNDTVQTTIINQDQIGAVARLSTLSLAQLVGSELHYAIWWSYTSIAYQRTI